MNLQLHVLKSVKFLTFSEVLGRHLKCLVTVLKLLTLLTYIRNKLLLILPSKALPFGGYFKVGRAHNLAQMRVCVV